MTTLYYFYNYNYCSYFYYYYNDKYRNLCSNISAMAGQRVELNQLKFFEDTLRVTKSIFLIIFFLFPWATPGILASYYYYYYHYIFRTVQLFHQRQQFLLLVDIQVGIYHSFLPISSSNPSSFPYFDVISIAIAIAIR